MMQFSSAHTFGHFTDEIPDSDEHLTLQFSPGRAPRKRRWSNFGLSADFLGDYFAAFFPGDEVPDSKINRKDTIKSSVSYIANELLENAVKYNDEGVNWPVTISLYLYEQEIIFHVVNYANRNTANKYCDFVQELVASDIDDLYMRQLEKTATGSGESHMGLLTMINDYSARFGWKFQTVAHEPDVMQVDVVAYLDV
ncbi:MAG TPA: hypothetical protein V6C88_16350 [Chroococcidiopsis sp.]